MGRAPRRKAGAFYYYSTLRHGYLTLLALGLSNLSSWGPVAVGARLYGMSGPQGITEAGLRRLEEWNRQYGLRSVGAPRRLD
jgi:hypothetical protein